MSSSLNALKQAGNDSPDQGNESRPSFNVRNALSSQELKKRNSLLRAGRVVGLLVLLVVLAIISYSLLFLDNNIQSQTPHVAKKSPILDTQPDIAGDQKQKVANSLVKTSDPPESVDKVPADGVFSIKTKEKIMGHFDANPLTKIREMAPSKSPDETERISGDNASSIVQEATLGSSEKEPQISRNTEKETIPPLENDNLRVQAISWDKKPATRVAVIDNKILTEGDFVQGYRLVLIEKNSVILHFSGNNYRLEFKYR